MVIGCFLRQLVLPTAGAPPANNTFFCDAATQRCFSYFTASLSHGNASAHCAQLFGHLFAPRSLGQQLLIENYFKMAPLTDYYYWLGIKRMPGDATSPYQYVSNPPDVPQSPTIAPYAHWSWYQPTANRSANYDCVIAQQSFRYDLFSGNVSIPSQVADGRLYGTNPANPELAYGWNGYPCTGRMHYVCDVPAAGFPCLPPPSPPGVPRSPPPPPQPPVDAGLGGGGGLVGSSNCEAPACLPACLPACCPANGMQHATASTHSTEYCSHNTTRSCLRLAGQPLTLAALSRSGCHALVR